MKITRRCQRFACDAWFALDAFDPESDMRRYCSEKCERADEEEIRQTEAAMKAARQRAQWEMR
jgi:hypothetical protein